VKQHQYLALLIALLPAMAAAQIEQDEYGLTKAEHTISLFSEAQKPVLKLAQPSILSTQSNEWQIVSTEMIRVCEHWDGEIPRNVQPDINALPQHPQLSITTDTADIAAAEDRRHCLVWAEYPRYTYGTAHFYTSPDNVLNKPVILVQPYKVSLDNNGYSKEQFYADVNATGLVDSLRNAGYDIVLYRYQQQDAGIAFNAKGVQQLLQQLQSQSSVTSSAVIGLSIGGVVARFALAEQERQAGLHKVATYISFDAPHLGANFPRAILDNTSRLLSKVDSSLCGLVSACRDARRQLEAVLTKLNTKTFKEIIIDNPAGNTDRQQLLTALNNVGHVRSIPTLALTNGSEVTSQGAAQSIKTTDFKLFRAWYNGGSENFTVMTNPALDNTPGGYADFYQMFSNLIAHQPHPITTYLAIGQQHSFVSTQSALAGSAANFSEVLTYPQINEMHMRLTYDKARKIRQWLDTYQF
jgi:hypothetical protein